MMKHFKQIGLEMSLKPFKDTSDCYIEERVTTIFTQWSAMLRYAEEIAVLLWIGDGSEILEYTGDLAKSLEWGKYIGSANPRTRKASSKEFWDPEEIHNKHQIYMENPPDFTYGDIKRITRIIKEVGRKLTGKTILVGETFDPGPEFAVSAFKYEKHREICMSTMAEFPFVGCYATLHADSAPYAGFPQGIGEATPLGVFLGRQAQCFLSDLGFDYIWFSNGFGFGLEPWNATGSVFDGSRFDGAQVDSVATRCLGFWNYFRSECNFPIKTRGTNMTTGIDLSTDAVPLKEIYCQVEDLEPPPNSPWVSLDGDFGLELAGWMSHIAQIPKQDYPFRFYIHDPWWDNSPWLDRYERLPHDIHMPLSVSRIDEKGRVVPPSILEFLSVDNSFGETPDQVPNEVIPQILYARDHLPDQAGPLVWVYPFDLSHELMHSGSEGLQKLFLGDWYIRGAINRGLPLNTVVDTEIFQMLVTEGKANLFASSILLLPLIPYGEQFFKLLGALVQEGAKLVLYGSVEACPPFFLEAMGLETTEALSGEFTLETSLKMDGYATQVLPMQLYHPKEFSDGGIDTVAKEGTSVLVSVKQGERERVYATHTKLGKGSIAWIRASNSFIGPIKTQLPEEKDFKEYVRPSVLLRYLLNELGYGFFFDKQELERDEPVQVVSRSKNGFWFSGFVPDATTTLRFSLSWGAPVFTSSDTIVRDDTSYYRFDRAFTKECRVFVSGQKGENSVRNAELATIDPKYKRRILLRNLSSATVSFFPETGYENHTDFTIDRENTQYKRSFAIEKKDFLKPEVLYSDAGCVLRLEDYSGNLLISW
jgi:hypothetical protein